MIYFSVVIPTYNRKKFVKEAIDSVMKQTYSHYEIIVVDDGSTDGTYEILKPYIDSNVIRYFYQENQGVSSARNKGIKESKGEWIAFLDSDDIWLCDKLFYHVHDIAKYPEISVHVMNAEYHLQEGVIDLFSLRKFKLDKNSYKIYKIPFCTLLKNNVASLPSIVIKRDCFSDKLMFSTKLDVYEDLLLLLEISLSKTWCFRNIVSAEYLRRDEIGNSSLTQIASKDVLKKLDVQIYIGSKLKEELGSVLRREVKDLYIWLSHIHFQKAVYLFCLKEKRKGYLEVLTSLRSSFTLKNLIKSIFLFLPMNIGINYYKKKLRF